MTRLTILELDRSNTRQIQDIQNYQHITVDAKVLNVDDPITVNLNRTLQYPTVLKLTVWEDDIDIGTSYNLKNIILREYNHKNT